jgi:chemotaxis methyl-accepting protein methylase
MRLFCGWYWIWLIWINCYICKYLKNYKNQRKQQHQSKCFTKTIHEIISFNDTNLLFPHFLKYINNELILKRNVLLLSCEIYLIINKNQLIFCFILN